MVANRLLFYSHDTFGLGHFRRTLTIASHLRRHLPETSVLIMTGLETAYAFDTPPGIDFIKLPAVKKVGPDEYKSRHLRISFNRVRRLREDLIKTVAKSFKAQMLVVDNVPRGVEGELLPTLEFLRKHRPDTKVVLTLRDVLDHPDRIVPQWHDWGVYDILDRCYDEVWVVGSKELFDPAHLYEFPAAVSRKTKMCGYIVQHASQEAAEEIRRELQLGDSPLVLVSAGAGGDGYPLLRAYADGIDRMLEEEIRSVVFLGPDMPPSERNDLKQRLLPASQRGVLLFDFRPDLVHFLPLASVTVSMAGYNTVAEVLAHGRRAVVVPRIYPRVEQWMRARVMEDRGLLNAVDPNNLTPEALAEGIRTSLAAGVPPVAPVDFGGLRRIARRARRLLDLDEEG